MGEVIAFLAREWAGIVVFLVSGLGVWLTIKQTVWCWPVGLVAVIISVVVLYQARLYGDMALQVFYFLPAFTVGSIGKRTATRSSG